MKHDQYMYAGQVMWEHRCGAQVRRSQVWCSGVCYLHLCGGKYIRKKRVADVITDICAMTTLQNTGCVSPSVSSQYY